MLVLGPPVFKKGGRPLEGGRQSEIRIQGGKRTLSGYNFCWPASWVFESWWRGARAKLWGKPRSEDGNRDFGRGRKVSEQCGCCFEVAGLGGGCCLAAPLGLHVQKIKDPRRDGLQGQGMPRRKFGPSPKCQRR